MGSTTNLQARAAVSHPYGVYNLWCSRMWAGAARLIDGMVRHSTTRTTTHITTIVCVADPFKRLYQVEALKAPDLWPDYITTTNLATNLRYCDL